MSTPDTVTIMRATGRRLAKRIERDGSVTGYDLAKIVDLIPQPIADLTALGDLLAHLAHRRSYAILRGAPIDPNGSQGVRRLIHADPDDAATLRENPRSWLALDCDSLPAPPDLDLHDIAACGRAALDQLPRAFHGAACIVQATASHTIKPGLRLRLWVWLDRPLSGVEVKRWLAGAPVDPAIYAPAQPIYTADPVFAHRADPLPHRLAILPGIDHVTTPSKEALQPPPAPPRLSLKDRPPIGDKYVRKALENAVTRIMSAPGRHPAILKEARGLARLVDARILDEPTMSAVLHGAAAAVGKDDREEIDKIIIWALANPAGSTGEVRHHG
jgi:hypothetical protein